jgi:hypothetical protein
MSGDALELGAPMSERRQRTLHSEALLGALGPRTRPGERPEEVLLDLGIVSDRDFALELSLRAGLPMSGLRGFVPDEKLFLYVPVSLAQRERVCPLVLVGSSLKLATAYLDPDLSYVRSRFPHLELELVVAARSEILAALAPLTRG